MFGSRISSAIRINASFKIPGGRVNLGFGIQQTRVSRPPVRSPSIRIR